MVRIVVTGANRGIGFELTRVLARRGDTVVACCRDPQRAGDLAALSDEHPQRVVVERLDVADPASIAAFATRRGKEPLDVLVNNAGVNPDGAGIETADFDAFEATLRVNALGPLRMTRALLDALSAGRGKRIVNLTSVMGSIAEAKGATGWIAYRTSKAALNMAMTCVANELRGRGICVLLVHPGWVRTAMGGQEAPTSPQESARGIVDLLDRATIADSGRYVNTDFTPIPW